MKKILYVEDDETLAYLTQEHLVQQSYDITHAQDGKSAIRIFKEDSFDLCILDIMLPQMDGFELAQEIRALNYEIPIIFLSAKSLKEDRLKGLRTGADDYILKPFSIEELCLKIDIFLSRSKKEKRSTADVLKIGELHLEYSNYQLKVNDRYRKLTEKEAELLHLFFSYPNQVLKRDQILNRIWGDDDYFMGRSLDVFISRLRKMIHPESSCKIENLHGIGFRFTVKDVNS